MCFLSCSAVQRRFEPLRFGDVLFHFSLTPDSGRGELTGDMESLGTNGAKKNCMYESKRASFPRVLRFWQARA